MNIQNGEIVLVEWCISFIKNELTRDNELKLTHLNIEDDDETQKTHSKDFGYSLDECIQLFLAEEKLEDTIHCNNCACAQLFTKHYSIDKTPPVLIISLKRFKYAGTSNNKITTYINFPLRDFHVNNDTYDLYGVVNHMGDLNYGHYTSIINMNGQWVYFDDGMYYNVHKEEEVISSRAYILVYVNKKEPEEIMYYQLMRDIMLNFNAEDIEKEFMNDKFVQHDVVPRRFYEGEPVNTKYGKGYYVKDVSDVLGEIRTDKLVVTLPKQSIQHETVLSIKKVTSQMIKQKKKEDKERKRQEEIKREKERKERMKKKEEEERMKKKKEENDAMKFTDEEIEQQRQMLAQIQETNMYREYQYQQYNDENEYYDPYAQDAMGQQMRRDRRPHMFGIGSLFEKFAKGSSRKKKH